MLPKINTKIVKLAAGCPHLYVWPLGFRVFLDFYFPKPNLARSCVSLHSSSKFFIHVLLFPFFTFYSICQFWPFPFPAIIAILKHILHIHLTSISFVSAVNKITIPPYLQNFPKVHSFPAVLPLSWFWEVVLLLLLLLTLFGGDEEGGKGRTRNTLVITYSAKTWIIY